MKPLSDEPPSAWLPATLAKRATPSAASDEAPVWLVECRFAPQTLSYLADHGFHDLSVLPGSFYIGLARQIHRQLFQRDAVCLREIEFQNPVILNGDDTTLTVRVEERTDGRVVYDFFEATGDALRDGSPPSACAGLQVHSDATPNDAVCFDPDDFLARATTSAIADAFYRRQRDNGNQYGPAFQTLAGIWQSGSAAAGRFQPATSGRADSLTPPLLDAAAQLLSALSLHHGRTFILKSIDSLQVHAPSEPAWAHAVGTEADGSASLVGSVQVVDAGGQLLWQLSGVTLAFIDRPASEEETRLCVASTFTAEPLADSLRFWAGHFGRPARIDFAPYNQVFQQLLDPASAFHRNRDGINLLVLSLEDWLHEDRRALDPARAEACFGNRLRTVLPNGLEVVHLNRYETDYVYREIFEDRSYLRHGIQLADGATVVDIGANIGLFSLFVLSQSQGAAIYAYEPSPQVFDLLRANCAAHGDPDRVRAFNCGVAEKKGRAQFTFYESSSVFSSFHPDEREDRAAVHAVARNVLQHELPGGVEDADLHDLTDDRLRAETIDCPLTSVSDIIRENRLERIHLLKIDAEKSELGILRGIHEEHWPLIEQLVIEVHDRTGAAMRAIEEQLTHRGFRCAVVEEKLLEDSGLFNLYATRRAPVAVGVSAAKQSLTRKVEEFCTALDTFAASAPLVLAIAPRPAGAESSVLAAAEAQVLARAGRHPQIRALGSQAILARYPVRELHDPHSHQLGHMPFTSEGYAAIGTALSRAVFHLSAPPIKVIALDCDHTLWQGLCGEDGPGGVAVTPPFRRLQDFMIAQMQAGVLLALCSKNQEADVLAVFERHADMPLRREHLAGWRINWQPKPANLRTLAEELKLGLESFVFIDDNPVECAEVRAGCPEVLVLQLPRESARIPAFLESQWIFDRAAATREDRERSQWYQANAEREAQRAAAPTLRDFLDGLLLRVEVNEATDEQLGRVAQLTLRTNQFNLTSIRRSEGELRDLVDSGAICLVASVSDRFGDYGLVGAILFVKGADRYLVDTLLLSCRALGKGVEHRMVAELASRALSDGKAFIELPVRTTDRNEPARNFVTSLGWDGADTFELSAASLAGLRYEPAPQPSADASPATPERTGGFDRANHSAAMQRLGDELNSVEGIVAAMDSSRRLTQPETGPETLDDATALERSLTAIWKKALGRSRIGVNENFFDAGGTSLKAVVIVAAIRKELQKPVSIVALFECPTIKLLAERLDGSAAHEPATATSAESRGRQRRNKLVRRGVRVG